MCQERTVFSRFLLGSPSLWWNANQVLRDAKNMSAINGGQPLSVFLAAGELETAEALRSNARPLTGNPIWTRYMDLFGEPFDVVADTAEFEQILQGHANVTSIFDCLSGEPHSTSMLPAISRGLRWLEAR